MTTWIVLRAAGVGAYMMLFLAVAWGLIATTGVVSRRIAKNTSVLIHQVLGSVGLLLLAIHMAGLLLDEFVEVDALDLLIPLRVEKRPVAIALGVVGMYVAVVVLVTSWFRKGIGPVWWRRTHLLATPAFVLGMAHGMVAGTDTTRPWMWWTYVGTALVIVFLLVVRALAGAKQRANGAQHARPSEVEQRVEEKAGAGAAN